MRGLLAFLWSLLLCSCFASETPRIPASALSQPKDFDGPFWSISQYEKLEAKPVEFRREKAGVIALVDKDPGHFRLVEVLGNGVYLLISDEEADHSTYYLLQRREQGIWEMDNIGVADDKSFASQNLAYLRTIAGRHGLSLDDGTMTTEIGGDVHGMAIPGLFRDRQFLAAIEVQPMSYYLPMKPRRASGKEISLPTQDRIGEFLFVEGAPPVDVGIACLSGFAGRYVDDAAYSADYREVIIREQPGCQYRMERADASLSTLTLLAFSPDGETYIGIEQWNAGADDWHGYIWIVERNGGGSIFYQVTLQPNVNDAQLQSLRSKAMIDAATRHGLKLMGATIQVAIPGEMHASQLRDLMHDGQFTSGLAVMQEPGRWLQRSDGAMPEPQD